MILYWFAEGSTCLIEVIIGLKKKLMQVVHLLKVFRDEKKSKTMDTIVKLNHQSNLSGIKSIIY